VGVSGIHYNLSQINTIKNLTGHIPSILGCDYSNGWGHAIPPQKLLNYSCNRFLKNHWNKHGLIEINTHFSNPVSSNGGSLKNRSNLTFTDLLKPETETGQRWRSYEWRMVLVGTTGFNIIFYKYHNNEFIFRIQHNLKIFGYQYLIIYVIKKNLHNLL